MQHHTSISTGSSDSDGTPSTVKLEKGFGLKGEAAFQTHSFREAEPWPVISKMQQKLHKF